MFKKKEKRVLVDIPLVMRKAGCDCPVCSKIEGNENWHNGINEPMIGECVGFLKGVKLSRRIT